MEVSLTDTQKSSIELRCLEAVRRAEEIHGEMTPASDLKDDIVGTNSIRWTAIIFGVFGGLISLVIWRWVFGTFHLYEFIMNIGIPQVISSNLPELLSMKTAAFVAWWGTYLWGVEGRYYYAKQAFNAHERSGVLHSVCIELSDILPGAVPELDDYAHNHDDDRPNKLIEVALGRRSKSERKPKPRRQEPTISNYK